jgi:hypothetical protein
MYDTQERPEDAAGFHAKACERRLPFNNPIRQFGRQY